MAGQPADGHGAPEPSRAAELPRHPAGRGHNEDDLDASNTQFAAALKYLGVRQQYEVSPGKLGNRVGARFNARVLPSFERNLDSK